MGARVAGIEIPSHSPVFLAILGIHVPIGLLAVVSGVVAMLKEKRRGDHTRFGSIYFCSLSALFATSTALAALRWSEDYHLFALGALAFVAALIGSRSPAAPMDNRHRRARSRHGPFIHSDGNRVLRRQWKRPSDLERPAAPSILAGAECCRASFDDQGSRSRSANRDSRK